MATTVASQTYPLTQPTGYNITYAQNCIALVNVAIGMVKQWVNSGSPNPWPSTGWAPSDPCYQLAHCYNLNVLSTVVQVPNSASILNTSFTTNGPSASGEPFGFIAISLDGKSAYLIFHGSVTNADWAADGMYSMTTNYTVPYGTATGNPQVETGFYAVFQGMNTLQDALSNLIPKSVTNVFISGHSLGAAVATLCLPVALKCVPSVAPGNVFCYLTGSPMPGNQDFANYIQGLGVNFFRTVNLNDPVPNTPPAEHCSRAMSPSAHKRRSTPQTTEVRRDRNNHDPCCSYGYALFHPGNTANPHPVRQLPATSRMTCGRQNSGAHPSSAPRAGCKLLAWVGQF